MKKKLFKVLSYSVLFLFLNTYLFAQVGIGNTNPSSDALLEIGNATTTTKGLILPRVDLTGTANTNPLSAHIEGMVVFNKATAGDVTPGFYYNDGSAWIRISSGTQSNDWTTTGNSGTNAGTNFLGTTDANALTFRTNNINRFRISQGGHFRAFTDGTAASPILTWDSDRDIGIYRIAANTLGLSTNGTERMRLLSDGRVSINNNNPLSVDQFTVTAPANDDAVNGYASGTGTGVYGLGNFGVYGTGGIGVYGNVNSTGWAVRGSNAANKEAIGGFGNGTGGITLPSNGNIFSGTNTGGASFATNATGTGFSGVGNGGNTSITLTTGSGLAGTGTRIGIFGVSTESTSNPPNNTIGSAGGYFSNGHGGFVATAAWVDPLGGGDDDQNFKIFGTGAVSTIVKDLNENPVIMYAPESPECLFQDYGIGELKNGEAIITLDPILSKNIRVDEDHPIKIFIQLEGDCKGVFVTNKSSTGFTVKEIQGGRSNVDFSWSIAATRADENFYNKKGDLRVSHNSNRFPIAPAPLELKSLKTKLNETDDYVSTKVGKNK